MIEHEDWLKLTVEDAIDPELPICDAHHHLRYLQDQRYRATDFLRDAGGGHNIKKSVVIQSDINQMKGNGGGMTPVEETEAVIRDISSIKSKTDVGAGFIGSVDITLGSRVAPILEGHVAAGKNRFRGVRYFPPWQPVSVKSSGAKTWLSEPNVLEVLACLKKYSLTYDVMVRPHQFTELADLANKFPGTPIIVDHMGWARDYSQEKNKRSEAIEQWKRGISALVPCSNIYIKLGGLGMDIFGMGWNAGPAPLASAELAQAMAPYYLSCIELFGVKRSMFESNFPVDKESYAYTILWNALKRMTRDFSYADRCALFHDTAAQVYGL